VDQNAWDAVEFGSFTDQLVMFQKCPLPPVVRNKPGETQAEFGLMQPGAFGPEAIAAMSEALDAALKALQDTGQSDVVREIITGKTW
jgi:hypothetical protein